jgi:predicted nuclease of restriction endonuclease-like (RecB) superfamily
MVVEGLPSTPSANLPQARDIDLPNTGYAEVLADIKTRIDAARVQALRAANAELMRVYWHVGRHIAEQEDAAPVKRGRNAPKIVQRLSADLRAAYPDASGFSPRNLHYMRDFARAWTEEEMLQRRVATLPWGHIIELLGIRDPEVRAWYAERAGEWTRPVLQHHLANDLHLAQGAAPSNFHRALPSGEAEAAQALTRDPLVVDFIRGAPGRERDLELALLADIERFMTALGKGFSFYGRQVPLAVGEREFVIDLLFYHHPQRRFVVIELKVGEFDPEHAGKLNFYVSTVDDLLAGENDAPSIGILLCATRDEAVTEMTLRGISSPIAVARWKTGSEMTMTDEPTVSPGMHAELQEMREVEAELTAFAARQLAAIEEDTGDLDHDVTGN